MSNAETPMSLQSVVKNIVGHVWMVKDDDDCSLEAICATEADAKQWIKENYGKYAKHARINQEPIISANAVLTGAGPRKGN